MPIPAADEMIPLTRVPRHICSPKPPHLSTVMRWVLHGVGNPPVRLETLKIGGRRFTTGSMIEQFIHSTSGIVPESTPRSARRSAEIRRAEHKLDADGIE